MKSRILHFHATVDEKHVPVTVEHQPNGRFVVCVQGVELEQVTLLAQGSTMRVITGNRVIELVPSTGERSFSLPGGARVELERSRADGRRRPSESALPSVVTAPMPGRVVKVLVQPGHRVEPGTGLVVVEAMKMENEIGAPRAGVVRHVRVGPGDAVERDAPLVELVPE
jgi:biotin carboxyl carrier protein